MSTAPHGEQATLLSVEQVAHICGLSRRAVYDAIKRGELRAARICSRLRIRPDDVDHWLHVNAVTPEAATSSTPRAGRSTRPTAAGSFRAHLRRADRERHG